MDEQTQVQHDKLVEYLLYYKDKDASWIVAPCGDGITVHLTIKGVTRGALGVTMEEAFVKACKYFGVE